MTLEKRALIYVAGHRGMVGSALVRELRRAGYENIVTASRSELELRDPAAVAAFLGRHRPEVVFVAAARVGGIQANVSFPADFIYDNLAIQTNLIHQSHISGVQQVVMVGSSCVYPRECPQPMKEESLLTGPLEPTNEAYAVAKIAGVRMAQAYHRQHGLRVLCPMPSNLYGTNDSFDPQFSHVLSALVRKFCDAADSGAGEVTVWGSGSARREFMHVDDCARAMIFLLDRWDSPEIINVGTGTDVTIRELAEMIARQAGFRGEIRWDTSKPDGMPRKLLDVSKLEALGFEPAITLEQGIEMTIREYRERQGQSR